jgi:ABC-type oligopeptide transport system substrate-binding subunit
MNLHMTHRRRLAALACLVLTSACSDREAPTSAGLQPVPVFLRRGLSAEPDTLDPQLAEDNAALAIATELHEGLTRTGPDGSARPVPQLPALLALPAASPRRAPTDPARAPGSGPFRLVERDVGERLVPERNPYYWDADHVALEGVTYLTVQSPDTELKL